MKIFKVLLLSLMALSASHVTFSKELDDELVNFYIQEFKVNQDEAVKRLQIMNNSEPLIHELQNMFGDNITSIYFDNGQDFKLVIRTTARGKDIKEIKNLVNSQIKVPILIIKNSPRNAQAIANIIENQGNRLAKKIDGFMMMGYDGIKGKLIITIHEPDISKQNKLKNDKSLKRISGIETELEFIDNSLELNSLKERL